MRERVNRRRSAAPFAASARRAAAVALVAMPLALTLACRDAAEPFRPDDRAQPADPSFVRLTYGSGDDRVPVWSAGGDSIYFTSSRWEENPLAPATVLALPADGMGALSPLLRNVQEGNAVANWITAPALSKAGGRVAFVRLLPLLPDSPCVGKRVCPILANLPMVRLQAGELHARALDASGSLTEDLVLPLRFDGHSVEADPSAPGGAMTVSEYHPSQYQFEAEGRSFFRPAWSPDGSELVVSDGLRLLRWQLGAIDVVAIPGTEDGMVPAWSPDGNWIAYARYARTSSETFICEYQNVLQTDEGPITVTDCVERRTIHWAGQPLIVLVRPDGSEERVLGSGTDPAWSPDGLFVYASSVPGGDILADMIVRLPLDGGAATAVPRTEQGIEPAVSPDGRRLAFSRSTGGRSHDIWVVDLP